MADLLLQDGQEDKGDEGDDMNLTERFIETVEESEVDMIPGKWWILGFVVMAVMIAGFAMGIHIENGSLGKGIGAGLSFGFLAGVGGWAIIEV